MDMLAKGQRVPLANVVGTGAFQIGIAATGLTLDFACFGLDANDKLSDERYMTFFNQPQTPCGGLKLIAIDGDQVGFACDPARLPASIERLVLTASIDGNGTMAQLQAGYVRLLDGTREGVRFAFGGTDFSAERAVMLGELYRKDGQWRFMAVGQGFNGGLDALVQHFGGSVAEPSASPTPAEPPKPAGPDLTKRIQLQKRVEREAPHLVSLVKNAGAALQKVGLGEHRAKVCLVLDISGSMSSLYKRGLVQKFAERILALGCQFDDDGEIDVFLFGANVHQPAPMGLANCTKYVQEAITHHPLEGDTRYGRAIQAVRAFYFPDAKGDERKEAFKGNLPVYVMFVTDGSTSDKPLTQKQLRWASREPIFWQFMGIGDSDFSFLEKLDDLDGRLIDNADFFSVDSPDQHSESQLYDLLMTEYPGWLKTAKQHGLL